MSFLFKPYRSTRSAREVLARQGLKLVLSKPPLVFLRPRDRTSAERAQSFFPLCLATSLFVVLLNLAFRLLFRLSLEQGKCVDDNVDRTGTYWRRRKQRIAEPVEWSDYTN
jgi:hypothetical protein